MTFRGVEQSVYAGDIPLVTDPRRIVMRKFHVSASGATERCTATVRQCPYGEERHFHSLREAVTASMSNEFAAPAPVDDGEGQRRAQAAEVARQEANEAFVEEARANEQINEDGSARVELPIRWRHHGYDGGSDYYATEPMRIGKRQNPFTLWEKMKNGDEVRLSFGRGHGYGYAWVRDTPELQEQVRAYLTGLKDRLDDVRIADRLMSGTGLSASDLDKSRKQRELEKHREAFRAHLAKYEESGSKVTVSPDNQDVALVEETHKGMAVATVVKMSPTYSGYPQEVRGKNIAGLLAKNPNLKGVDPLAIARGEVLSGGTTALRRSKVMAMRKSPDYTREQKSAAIDFYNANFRDWD